MENWSLFIFALFVGHALLDYKWECRKHCHLRELSDGIRKSCWVLLSAFSNAFMPHICPLSSGEQVKQADVVLLGYPVMHPMEPEIRRNDLEMYEPVTDPQGPAMTWVKRVKGGQ